MNPPVSQLHQFDDFLEAAFTDFEHSWRSGSVPEILYWYAKTLDELGGLGELREVRQRVLFEFLAIDLEFRWKNRLSNEFPQSLEDNTLVRDVFGPREVWPEFLIAEEYRVWLRWGDQHSSSLNSRLKSIPNRGRPSCLLRVEAELAMESNVSHSPSPLRLPSDPRAMFEYRDLTLQTFLGSGGMGKVYRAWSNRRQQLVAVKFLRKSLLVYPAAIEQFVDEAQVLSQLKHPGIIGVHGLGQSRQGNYFLVMDLIPNGDLARLVQHGPIELTQVLNWGIQIASALELVHSQGIIHCDLKPANLLLRADRQVLVTDFGLAARISDRGNVSAGGTAPYMAPEQFDPHIGRIGPATDIYGLGTVLFQLFHGQRPPAYDHIRSEQSAIPFHDDTSSDVQFRLILSRCLQTNPEARFSSMTDLKTTLINVLNR